MIGLARIPVDGSALRHERDEEAGVEPARLEGKIVFIGSSASGLQDMHATPVMRLCPGVDLHALAADAILRRDFFVEPAWTRGGQALILGAKVTALLAGRFNVAFEDVQAIAPAALRHRLLLNFEGLAEGINTDAVISELLKTISA